MQQIQLIYNQGCISLFYFTRLATGKQQNKRLTSQSPNVDTYISIMINRNIKNHTIHTLVPKIRSSTPDELPMTNETQNNTLSQVFITDYTSHLL